MYLVRLTYYSEAVGRLTLAELSGLLERARTRNAEAGVTGKLCVTPRWFLQCLEGGHQAVNATFRRIVADPRHRDVALLHYTPIDERCFDRWDMAYCRLGPDAPAVVRRFSPGAELDPARLTPSSAYGLLQALSNTKTAGSAAA